MIRRTTTSSQKSKVFFQSSSSFKENIKVFLKKHFPAFLKKPKCFSSLLEILLYFYTFAHILH